MKKILSYLFVILLVLSTQVNAIDVSEFSDDVQMETAEEIAIKPLPIYNIPLNILFSQINNPEEIEVGKILYSENGPAMVISNIKTAKCLKCIDAEKYVEAYHLNYKKPERYGITEIQEEIPVPYYKYKVLDFAPKIIQRISTSKYDSEIKQTLIWAYEDVDTYSLYEVWTKYFYRSETEWKKDIYPAVVELQKISPALDLKEAQSKLKVEITPQGYSKVWFSMYNPTNENVIVTVHRGRTLENLNKKNQNIALGETKTVYIPANEKRSFYMASYCINQHKGSPTESDKTIVGGYVEEKLQKVIAIAESKGVAGKTESQSAVWHITDRAEVSGYASNLVEESEGIEFAYGNAVKGSIDVNEFINGRANPNKPTFNETIIEWVKNLIDSLF